MDVLLTKEKGKLTAADPISAESLAEIAEGEVLTSTLRRTRNPRHHRLFFALLKIVYENQDRFATLTQLLNRIKIETGYYDLETLPGKIPVQILIPRSISFAKMQQDEFRQFFDKAVSYIIEDVLPGIDKQELEQHVLEMVG